MPDPPPMIKLGIFRGDGLHTHEFFAAAVALLATATVFLSTALFLENKQTKISKIPFENFLNTVYFEEDISQSYSMIKYLF